MTFARAAVAASRVLVALLILHTALAQSTTKNEAVYTTLYSFGTQTPSYPNGFEPYGGLLLGSDGNFYGTTLEGGAPPAIGVLYRISTTGAFELLHSFLGGTDGGNPDGPLAMDASGAIYGTTKGNTAFRYTPGGAFTSFGTLPGGSGATPNGLVYASDGNLYGTSLTPDNGGLLFRITPAGVITTVASGVFGGFGFLLPGPGGLLYGLVNGNFASVTLAGVITQLAQLSTVGGGLFASGVIPGQGFILGSDGNFYFAGNDIAIQVTPAGIVTLPSSPELVGVFSADAPLIQGTDANLYLANDSIYQITTGLKATLYSSVGSPGAATSAMVQGPDGAFYCTTYDSGGAIYRVTLVQGSSSNSGGGSGGSSDSSAGTGNPDDGSGNDYGVPQALGNPSDMSGSICPGDPVCVASGNLYETVTDYQTSGPDQLSFTRYYNSIAASNTYANTLGTNWRSNYDLYLRVGIGTVLAERADGQQVPFTRAGLSYVTDRDIDLQLANYGATWTVTDSNDNVEIYNSISAGEARLTSIQTRNGYTQTLHYGAGNQLISVTDSFSRTLAFTYNGGQLQTVTTPDGLVLTYSFTGNLLASVAYSTSPSASQTYLYENPALPSSLTGILDENGNRYATWTYDSSGRTLSSQQGAGAGLTTFTYNTDGTRTVTNPLGEQEVYTFTTILGVSKVTEIDRIATASLPAATRKFTYDASGYTASKTDWNGNLTTYLNDSRGEPTTINEAVGTPQARTTTITYHPIYHLPLTIVTPGITTTFTYDFSGQLLTKSQKDTTTTTVPYSTGGQTRTWTYTWSNFLLASMQTPRTDVTGLTRYTYDTTGAQIATTNALGQTIQVTQHLPGGLPLTTVDVNGVVTNQTYDPRLHLLSSTLSTAAGPLTTSYAYDAAENLLTVTQPDGSAITNSYDGAHRLTGFTDLFNQAVSYALDAQGDQTQSNTADLNGNLQRTHSAVFDALGRLQQDVGGAGQTTSYTYDSNGNAIAITDPLGRVTHRTFDALNRVVSITDPNGGVTAMSYDAHGRTVGVTDPNGSVTTYVYDGFADLIQRVSPDSGTTIFHYDLDGNKTQRIDGNGNVTLYTYDALDRQITVAYPADPTENVTYTYDQGNLGVGRLTGVTDAAGTLARSYDERGNLLNETRTNGAATLMTAYSYDAASRLASLTYPSGWTVIYTRDIMGRAISVTAQPPDGSGPTPVLLNVAYQPFGPANGLAFGNGIIQTRSFDFDYRVTGLNDVGANVLQFLTYVYDAANNVSSIADGVTPVNSQSFTYDVLDRILSAAGGYGSFGYTYDSVGNRLSESAGNSPTAYSYTAHSNQLAALTAGGTQQAIGYDKAGHITAFGSGAVTAATYNQAGQLAAVMAGTNVLAQYTYDAFARRVARVGSVTATTLYQYDQGGPLLEESGAETDGEVNAQVDYIYLGAIPVATISPSAGQVYFLHDDRLGTPQKATDSNQNIVWTASYAPFGEMSAVPGLIVQNLRLPGQEFDVNTGFYHNGYRDYAPQWGRYLQSDPFGIAGGMNTYGYVSANPLKYTDRQGLSGIVSEAIESVTGFGVEKVIETALTPYVGETLAAVFTGGGLAVAAELPEALAEVAVCPPCAPGVAVQIGLTFAAGALTSVAEDNIAENTWGLVNTIGNALTGGGSSSGSGTTFSPSPSPSGMVGDSAYSAYGMGNATTPTAPCAPQPRP